MQCQSEQESSQESYPALVVFQRHRASLQRICYYPLSLTSLLIEQEVLTPDVLRQVDERPSDERVVMVFTFICASLACAPNKDVACERLHKCIWAMGRLFPESSAFIESLKLAFYEEEKNGISIDCDKKKAEGNLI